MKHNTKRFTILGVLTIALLALVGLAAMAVYLHKQEIKKEWNTENIITLEGNIACLPPKNSDQPHTLECASGLKVNGAYYSLKYAEQLPTEGEVVVTGAYKPPVSEERYDTVGSIEVTSVKKK